jgi:hypothetical protein
MLGWPTEPENLSWIISQLIQTRLPGHNRTLPKTQLESPILRSVPVGVVENDESEFRDLA